MVMDHFGKIRINNFFKLKYMVVLDKLYFTIWPYFPSIIPSNIQQCAASDGAPDTIIIVAGQV